MKKRLLIPVLVLVGVAMLAGRARCYSIPIQRDPPVSGLALGTDRGERMNGPKQVMKSHLLYERMLPELRKFGISHSEFAWRHLTPIVHVGDTELVIFIPRLSRADAEGIASAASLGIADFQFQNEN